MRQEKGLVGGVPGDVLGTLVDIMQKLRAGAISPEELKAFARKENPFGVNWLTRLIDREIQAHKDFFGEEAKCIDYALFEETLRKLGEDRIAQMAGLLLQPAFLPPFEMTRDRDFPGWKVKPEKWFYEKIAEGKIDKKALYLGNPDGGDVILFDIRCKPQYDDGKQMWENDELFLGPVIEGLRNEGKIVGYEDGPQSSRFGVSAIEAEQHVWPSLAESLGLKVISERVVQGSYLSQADYGLPRAKDGQTNTAVWFAEAVEGGRYRLSGADSDCGGRAHVDCRSVDDRWRSVSCLPLVVLSS